MKFISYESTKRIDDDYDEPITNGDYGWLDSNDGNRMFINPRNAVDRCTLFASFDTKINEENYLIDSAYRMAN